MPKTALEQWDETAANNTDIGGLVLSNATQIDALDDIEREHMSQIAKWLGDDTVASASTADLGAVPGRYVNITGTTTITAFGTIKAGTVKYVKFAAALTLTHNATSLILPGGANITTAAGDTAIFVSEGSGNWRCVAYQPAAVAPFAVTSFTPAVIGTGTAGTATYSVQSGLYTKSGRLVTFEISLAWSGHTGAGNMRVSGLPFASVASPAFTVVYSDITFTNPPMAFASAGTEIILRQAASGAAYTDLPLDTAGTLLIAGSYFTA